MITPSFLLSFAQARLMLTISLQPIAPTPFDTRIFFFDLGGLVTTQSFVPPFALAQLTLMISLQPIAPNGQTGG